DVDWRTTPMGTLAPGGLHRPAPTMLSGALVPRRDLRAVPRGSAGGRPDRGRGGVPPPRSLVGRPPEHDAARDAGVLLRPFVVTEQPPPAAGRQRAVRAGALGDRAMAA